METSEKLNFQDIVDLLSEKVSISKSEAEAFLRELFSIIPETLTENDPVKIKNFGAFKLTSIQARESVDVNTGEKIEIPTHYRLSFAPATTLKDLVNKPFSHFETVLLNEGISFENLTEDSTPPDSEEDEQPEEIIEIPTLQTIVEKESEPQDIPIEIEEIEVKTEIIEEKEDETEKLEETEEVKEAVQITIIPEPISAKEETSEAPVNEKRKSKKGVFLFFGATAAVLLIAFFLFIQKNRNPKEPVVAETIVPVVVADTLQDSLSQITDTVPQLKDSTTTAAPIPETVTLTSGKTLRLIALEKFGNKEFWVYIFLKNSDKIKNPNIVPIGTELLLPNKSEYDMDAQSTESIAHARKAGEELMRKYQ